MADQVQLEEKLEEKPAFLPKVGPNVVANEVPNTGSTRPKAAAKAVAAVSSVVPKAAAAAPKAAVKGFVPKAAIKGFVPKVAAKDTGAKPAIKVCPLVKPLPPNIIISETIKLPEPKSTLEAIPQQFTGEIVPSVVRKPISMAAPKPKSPNEDSNLDSNLESDIESYVSDLSDADSDLSDLSDADSDVDDIIDKYETDEYNIIHDDDAYQLNTEVYVPQSSRSFKKFITDEYQDFELQPNPNKLDENACQKLGKAAETGVESFLYQKFVREYMRNNSPYRGILVYHGLGSGKTCSAIAAAEALYGSSTKKIIVMTPFSLQNNFIREITFCGFKHYHMNNYWNPIPIDEEDGTVSTFAYNTLDLPDEYLKKVRKYDDVSRQVIWVPDFDKPSNIKERSPQERVDIFNQITESIKNRITFISYNGISAKRLKEYACTVDANGNRFFDNKIIVIDEIHNLTRLMHGKITPYIVQRAKKQRKIPAEPIVPGKWKPGLCGKALNYNRAYLFYKLLSDARNSKIIGLSGTPIINFPDELGILSNILSGYIECVECTIRSVDKSVLDKLYTLINKEPRVDVIRFRSFPQTYQVLISVFPEGYEKVYEDSKKITVKGVHYNKDAQESIRDIYKRLKPDIDKLSKTISEDFKSYPRLPVDEEEFKNEFVDPGTLNVKNPLVLKKRLTGLISYYQGSKEEYMPRVIRDKLIKCKMSNYMLSLYVKERKREIDGERQTKEEGDIFSAVEVFAKMANPSSYRFRSRAFCNFTFPVGMTRPFPNNGVAMDMLDAIPEEAEDSEKLKKLQEDIAQVDTDVVEADELREEDDKAIEEEVTPDHVPVAAVKTSFDVDDSIPPAVEPVQVLSDKELVEEKQQFGGSGKPIVRKPISKPLATPAPKEPLAEVVSEPLAEAVSEPVSEPVSKPVASKPIVRKPIAKPAAEPVAEPAPKPLATPLAPKPIVRKPIAKPLDKPLDKPVSEPLDKPLEVKMGPTVVESNDSDDKIILPRKLEGHVPSQRPPRKSKKYAASSAPIVPIKGVSQMAAQQLQDYGEQLRQLMETLDDQRYDFLELGEDSDAEIDAKEDREVVAVTSVQEEPDKKKDGEEPYEHELKTYSCKLHKMLHKINKSKGSNLVYSQFKTVEGLGVLGIALKANDYEEITIEGSDENPQFSDETLESFQRDKEARKKDPKKRIFTKRFILFTGEGSIKRRQLILNIFNGNLQALPTTIRDPLLSFEKDGNNYGEICWVIGITGAGAEGISLKCCRTVHIMEPYWNNVRLEQVKGRAIRICSHKDLPFKERTVKIYTYCTVFSAQQKDKLDNTIKISDGDKTSDRNVYDVSSVKDKINSGFLQIMKESAIDCMLNRVDNTGIQCLDIIGMDRPGKIPSYMFDPNLEYDKMVTAIEFKQTAAKPVAMEKAKPGTAKVAYKKQDNEIFFDDIHYKGKDYKACLQPGTSGLVYNLYDIPNVTAGIRDQIAEDSRRPRGTLPQIPIAGTIDCNPLYARTSTPYKGATIELI